MDSQPEKITGKNRVWNERSLSTPPVISIPQVITEANAYSLRKMRAFLEKAITPSNTSSKLSSETYILNRMIYKSGRTFHLEKFMQNSKQVTRSIKRLGEADFLKPLKTLLNMWPRPVDVVIGTVVYLPSKSLLQHVLVRLLGAAQVLHRIINMTVICHSSIMDKIHQESHLNVMLVFAAVVSRICFFDYLKRYACLPVHQLTLMAGNMRLHLKAGVVCRAWKKEVVDLYESLYRRLEVLPNTDSVWLKDDSLLLPEDLLKWLGTEKGMKKLQTRTRTEVGLSLDKWKLAAEVNWSSDERDSDNMEDDSESPLVEDIGIRVCRAPLLQEVELDDIWKTLDSVESDRVRQQRVDALTEPAGDRGSTSVPEDCEIGTPSKGSNKGQVSMAKYKRWIEKIQACDSYLLVGRLLQSFLGKAGVDPAHYETTCEKICALKRHAKWSPQRLTEKAQKMASRCLRLVKRHQKNGKSILILEDDVRNTSAEDYSGVLDKRAGLSPRSDSKGSVLKTKNEPLKRSLMTVKIWQRRVDRCRSASAAVRLVKKVLMTAGVDRCVMKRECERIGADEEQAKHLAKTCLENFHQLLVEQRMLPFGKSDLDDQHTRDNSKVTDESAPKQTKISMKDVKKMKEKIHKKHVTSILKKKMKGKGQGKNVPHR